MSEKKKVEKTGKTSYTLLAALVVLAIALALATALVQQLAKPSAGASSAGAAQPTASQLVARQTVPTSSPSPSPRAQAEPQAGPLSEAQVLYVAAQSPLVREFIAANASYKIFFLNASTLAALAREKSIYANLNVSEAYEIRFATKEYGLLVLVGGERVLREFPVLGLQLEIKTK